TARAPGYAYATADGTVLKDQTVAIGYVRLVPSVRPAGQPTLPPPPTPSPAPSPTPSAAASASPAVSGSPVSPSPSPTATPSGSPSP
ncbi:MAG TPA: hypothetical protein VFE36_09755, partial [Candidatus Baltobacteraceae bacterium]|nr:hypothetical protein [Candidatus Baltobacteraceae bacterium]